jgi:uncharacterized protein YggE
MDDHVRVSGAAGRSLAPDRVVWRADAVEYDENPRAAFERCGARLNQLSERLSEVGDITTSAVTVQPDWESGERPSRTRATGGVRVRADVARAGAVAQAAMAAGADTLDGPRFVYERWDATREELLDDAMADARRKAERLAAAAGRRLGRVRSVEAVSDDRHVVEAFAVSGGPDVTPREQTVTATVTVVFALTDL